MQPKFDARPARSGRSAVLLAIIALVGCSGSGTSCGSGSCGGAFKTTDAEGKPIVFDQGTKLDNVAQVRITRSGFNFLNATHLNDLLTGLNGNAPQVAIPCLKQNIGVSACIGSFGTEFLGVFIGDQNFDMSCATGEGPNAHVNFKSVTWGLDSTNQILRAKLLAHIWTDPIFIHTEEAHSGLCGTSNGNSPVQARVFYDDERSDDPTTQKGTQIDLDIKFTTSPDGRMQLNVTDASLNAIINRFDAGFINIDGFSSGATIPAKGRYKRDACGSDSGSGYYEYNVEESPGNLNCGGFLRVVNANCDPLDPDPRGLCKIFQAVRDYLLNTLKNQFAPQIVNLLRTQIDKARCQRFEQYDVGSKKTIVKDCDNASYRCPNDDTGVPLVCDTGRGVCVPQGQTPLNPGPSGGTISRDGKTYSVGEHNCEPIPFGVTGQLDVAALTTKVGFPAGAGLLATFGLGSKTAAAAIDTNGLQLAAMAGTSTPKKGQVSVCVPASNPASEPLPPALNFDDAANKPSTVGTYDVGISIAAQMANRAMYDAYLSGLLCLTLDNKTTSFISSGLFKTFLPSIGRVTGDKDVPMMILLRPTVEPYIRIGKGTLKQNTDGTFSPDDALLTVNFRAMNLDFYGLVDERQVRLFTLQADLALPLGLRTYPGTQADTLQPVLGGLDTVLTNIKALNNEMLAEDPGVVRDLLGAAVRLAQPLLAGILQPVQLPSLLGLKLYVGGITGAVPVSSNLALDGYQHLAIYASIAECGQTPCARYSVKADARIVARNLPNDANEVRERRLVPSVDIEASALQARRGEAEFSYRVDGGLWSPWVKGPRFTIRDPIFLFQGRHNIEVTAREAGDDHTQDMEPVQLDVFVSYESPRVELVERNDGAIVTKASSASTPAEQLLYSYRLGADGAWSKPGPARAFDAGEVAGRSLSVSVTDLAGRATTAKIGEDASRQLLLASGAVGCSTSSSSTNGAVLLLLALATAFGLRRRRQ